MVKRKVSGASPNKVGGEVSANKKRRPNALSENFNEVDKTNSATDCMQLRSKSTRRMITEGKLEARNAPKKEDDCGLHPLLIDHILDKVFQHVFWPTSQWPNVEGTYTNNEDVRNVRLVCKQWHETGTRLFRRGRSPTMFGTAQSPFSQFSLTPHYDKRMERFLEIMKTSPMIPVQRYTIGSNFFLVQNQRLMKDFMRICGPSATELKLYFDNSSNMKFTRRSFPDLKLSKLKTLLFNCGNYRGRNVSSQTYELSYLVEVILNAAENLQEFRFEFPPKDIKWQSTVVRRFGDIISTKIPITVKILRLDMWLNDSNLKTLAEADLKLEEFQFDCHSNVGKSMIRKFLEKQSETLKVLRILNSEPKCAVSVDFPRLDQLRHMELQGADINPFSYPETFPKLETLNLMDWKSEKPVMQLLPSSSKKAFSVKEIFFPSQFPQATLIRKAAQCFPNLKTVHIAPSPDIAEALQETFVYLSNIEELFVSFPFLLDNELNVDSLFSGVSELDCRRIQKHRNFDNVNVKDVQKKPSITNLTKLRKLVLEDSACDVLLTDFSAHFVFMKMESLIELHTSRFRMSSKYVDMLREKLSLKLVEDDYSDYTSDDSLSDNEWNSDSDGDDFQMMPWIGFNVFFLG